MKELIQLIKKDKWYWKTVYLFAVLVVGYFLYFYITKIAPALIDKHGWGLIVVCWVWCIGWIYMIWSA